jgi:hypothetical protein
MGAREFGWQNRPQEPLSQRDGDWLIRHRHGRRRLRTAAQRRAVCRAALPRPSVKLDRVELRTGGNIQPGDDFAVCR